MAIVQISRITNRKGATENLPQLSGAEFGWCIDSRRLFIGNGTLEEGAPVIGNTEILTQYSDIAVLSTYTYADVAVGYAAQTGPTPSDPVVRTVQEKLDDFADVRDFGAVGNGVVDDTDAINRALYELYCRSSSSLARRSLYFPAGTYRISDTIIIPTYAKLVGEGADCTIILLSPEDSSVPDYVARYGDSRQQVGTNIGLLSATPPRNIEISSMSFQSAIETNIFLVDQATGCWFDSVSFQGSLTQAQIENAGAEPLPEVIGVSFNSYGDNTTNDITFDKCFFSYTKYGIETNETIQGVTVSNSGFTWLEQGVSLTDNPTGVRIVHNIFNNIFAEGIICVNTNLNASAYNIFYNVGDNIGSPSPVTPIISFTNDTNVSINDLFSRTTTDNYSVPRVRVQAGSTSAGGTQTQLGRYAINAGETVSLGNNQSNQTIVAINQDEVKAFEMKYTITRDDAVRHGVLKVATGPFDNSLPVQYDDEYIETANTGITITVTQSANQVLVLYSSSNTGFPATLTQTISYLA